MAKQKVLSSNMAATPLSFGSLAIDCKVPIGLCRQRISYFADSIFEHILILSESRWHFVLFTASMLLKGNAIDSSFNVFCAAGSFVKDNLEPIK